MISRRGLLGGVGALLCAPAIVRASNLMAIKPFTAGPVAGEQLYAGDLIFFDHVRGGWYRSRSYNAEAHGVPPMAVSTEGHAEGVPVHKGIVKFSSWAAV